MNVKVCFHTFCISPGPDFNQGIVCTWFKIENSLFILNWPFMQPVSSASVWNSCFYFWCYVNKPWTHFSSKISLIVLLPYSKCQLLKFIRTCSSRSPKSVSKQLEQHLSSNLSNQKNRMDGHLCACTHSNNNGGRRANVANKAFRAGLDLQREILHKFTSGFGTSTCV